MIPFRGILKFDEKRLSSAFFKESAKALARFCDSKYLGICCNHHCPIFAKYTFHETGFFARSAQKSSYRKHHERQFFYHKLRHDRMFGICMIGFLLHILVDTDDLIDQPLFRHPSAFIRLLCVNVHFQ